MSEVRNVQSQMVDERCPSCKNSWMRPTGVVQTTNPPSYEHSCSACGYKQMYGMRFPYTV
jgi:hypothetical protein